MDGDSNQHSASSTLEIPPKGVIGASDELEESSSAVSESVSPKKIDTVNTLKETTENEARTEEQPPTKRPKSDLDDESGLGNVSTTSIAGTVSDIIALKPKDFTLDAEELKNALPRKFQRIPIFIADYHNDVLEFIFRCLATRHLPLENNILIHFDSHPDMVISREIPASASFDKETMLAELSIENWIMPACYAGHFNRVIWLKNSWCQQIPIGKYNFQIGHKNDKISVDCPLDYFISEDTSSDSAPIDTAQFIKEADGPNFVLDIDLDFFSTSNPFLEIYKDANCYKQLTDIFHFEPEVKDCGGTTERRKLQLEALKKIFEHLEETRTLDGLTPAPDPNIIAPETYARIENLAKSLQKHYADDEIDWLLIYDSGSTTDTNGLPHHISTSKELEQYIGQFKCLLQNLPSPPVLITMACSAEDDYCPKHQVGVIQERVLQVLREVFGDRLHDKPILHYLDEEWDVMQL
nr:UPF0489 protein C5orf22 homolog isoform X2 [Bactrocera oleae]